MTVAGQAAGGVAAARVRRSPRSASRSRRSSRRRSSPGRRSAASDDFAPDTYVAARRSRSRPAIGDAGKTTVYVRQRNPDVDTEERDEFNEYIAISTRCMHLGCPVRFVEAAAALHLPVPRRRLRLPGQGRRRPAGAPARPLLHPRRRRHASRSARATASTPSSSASRPRPRRATRRHRAVPLPAASHDAQAPETPSPMPKLPAPPVPGAAAARRPQAARARQYGPQTPRRARRTRARRSRRRLDRRAHLAVRRLPAGCCSARCPKGTNWFYTLGSATLFAFLVQAVTGVFLAMYYDAVGDPGLRLDPLHHQRRLPRRVRPRHAQVGLVGDGDPDLPAHGRGPSSSAPTSTRASSTG